MLSTPSLSAPESRARCFLPFRDDHGVFTDLVIDQQRNGSVQVRRRGQSHHGFLHREAHLLQLLQPDNEKKKKKKTGRKEFTLNVVSQP